MLTRTEVDEYLRYAERLSTDLEVCLSDLRFREAGGKLHLAVDFSEIHSFLMPDRLPDDWLWPGLDEDMKAVVEHCALSEVLTGPPKPILLAPYYLEFQNFLANQRASAQFGVIADGAHALDELDELTKTPTAQSVMELALRIDREQHQPTPDELAVAVKFFEGRAASLVSIVRGELLVPLERARAFLQTNPFVALDAVTPVQLSGREPEVDERFKRLKRIRSGERDGATFLDALGLEYVRQANRQLIARNDKARVLLVSRSPALGRLVAEETRQGLWPDMPHGVLRHPRSFAPLAWYARRAQESPVASLEATRASLGLCSRSARLRLAGNWDKLDHSRSDRDLAHQITELKEHIFQLTKMGGGINESRILTKRAAPTEHEVIRLLAMLRNHDEVLNAVALRMAEINTQINRGHELVGLLMHIDSDREPALDVQHSSRNVRTLIPRMGRIPYGLRFTTPHLLQLLDDLRRKESITHDDVRELAVIATQKVADHYETLLFMAYVLVLLGRYELAGPYCRRARQSAATHNRADDYEAVFLQALCTRVLAESAEQYEEAVKLLNSLDRLGSDPRHLAEQGNIRLQWYERALLDPKFQPSPAVDEAIAWLARALEAASDDKRLRVSIQNSLCYAWTNAYEARRLPEVHRQANQALMELIEGLYAIEENPDHWPLRIKDTIARAILSLSGRSYDVSLLRRLVESIRIDLESDSFRGDRTELRNRLRDYQAELSRR